MANDITSAASFTTANMKPIPDEQIDALWGQNIADNTGHLYYRKVPGPCFGHVQQGTLEFAFVNPQGTFYFEKQPGMATFFGSLVKYNNSGNVTLTVKMRGTTIHSNTFSVGYTNASIGTNLVGVSDGDMVPVTWELTSPSGNTAAGFSFTGWQKV